MRTGLTSTIALVALALAGTAAACGDTAPAATSPRVTDAGTDASAALCVDGKPSSAYPPGPYAIDILETLPPDLVFESESDPIRLSDHYDPCAAEAHLLVVRSSAAWCGPCLWQAAHTRRILEDPRLATRITFVDLLMADEDNVPATLPALARWRAKVDAPTAKLGLDPRHSFARSQIGTPALPWYLVVDTRTMQVVTTLNDPDPETLAGRLALELADLDKLPRPSLPEPTLFDGLFTENEIDLVRGMKLGGAPPPDPTNEYGDDAAAAAFGKTLFSDPLLSPGGTVSCATCHDPARSFTDGTAQSTGVAIGDRNSPSVALAAHARWQFWDGRADTLWMQALLPLEDAKEHGSSRLFVAHQIAARYSASYAAIFGGKYPLPDLAALPPSGKPGESAFDTLPAEAKQNVDRIFVNVGKAIAAFERTLRVKPNALDRYIDGDLTALSTTQKRGLASFLQNGCSQCHWGPRMTDDAFHVLRFPTGRQDKKADVGRDDGLLKLEASEFRASSQWSDAPSLAKPFALDTPEMLGAFRTPPLRGITSTAPYGHGGTLATLTDVADHYSSRGLEHQNPGAIGTTEPWVPSFDKNVVHDVPLFLEVLTADAEP